MTTLQIPIPEATEFDAQEIITAFLGACDDLHTLANAARSALFLMTTPPHKRDHVKIGDEGEIITPIPTVSSKG